VRGLDPKKCGVYDELLVCKPEEYDADGEMVKSRESIVEEVLP
jgi:hypothetical protein